jgi:hypothetical protein
MKIAQLGGESEEKQPVFLGPETLLDKEEFRSPGKG